MGGGSGTVGEGTVAGGGPGTVGGGSVGVSGGATTVGGGPTAVGGGASAGGGVVTGRRGAVCASAVAEAQRSATTSVPKIDLEQRCMTCSRGDPLERGSRKSRSRRDPDPPVCRGSLSRPYALPVPRRFPFPLSRSPQKDPALRPDPFDFLRLSSRRKSRPWPGNHGRLSNGRLGGGAPLPERGR